MRVGALFSYKLKRGLAGRRQSVKIVETKLNKTDHVIWMHAASLGEYEQGLPVLQKLKTAYPDYKILITFFSPSGYENVIKKNHIADAVCYLPFDEISTVREFSSKFQTKIFFTVKYDYWYHLLSELKKQGAKIYVVSAFFYETQVFFKVYGGWFARQLKKNVDWIFHQTKHSTALAKSIGLTNSSTSGDTRFDRVKSLRKQDNSVEWIDIFKNGKKTLVFGSSWEAEEHIAEIISKKTEGLKLIIAPHDLKRVEHLKKIFPTALLYTHLNESQVQLLVSAEVLIIDCIGLLSKIYSYADLAVVGGGFHSAGLHNILEAATFGVPVFFGNHYQKNPEADALIEANGAKSFEDEFYAAPFIIDLLKNPEVLKNLGENAGCFVEEQPDSAEIIVKKILGDFQE